MSVQLFVDPVACDGHGLCADLFPEGIVLDDWGYPMLSTGEISPTLEAAARRAVSSCPKLALVLRPVDGRPTARS